MRKCLFILCLVSIGCGGNLVQTRNARVVCGNKDQNIDRVLFDGVLGRSRYLIYNKRKELAYEIYDANTNQLLGAYEKCVMMR